MTNLHFGNINELRDFLLEHDYDISKWCGKHKSVEDLWREYLEGERSFQRHDTRGLVMVTNVLNVTVFNPTKTMKLVEDRIIPTNGEPYTRGYDHISEKMKPNENIIEGTQRALAEELSLTEEHNTYVQPDQITIQSKTIEPKESGYYPGLMGHYHVYKVTVVLSEHQMQESYVEKTPAKTIYFKWVECA